MATVASLSRKSSAAASAAAADTVRHDDSRMSNSRTPTAHAASHATAGSDPVTPAAIGAATSGHTHSAAAVYAAPRDGGTVSTAQNVDGTLAGDAYYVVTANVVFTPTGSPLGRRMVIKAQASGASRTPSLSGVTLPASGGPTSLSQALTTGQTVSWALEYCPLEAAWILNAVQVV